MDLKLTFAVCVFWLGMLSELLAELKFQVVEESTCWLNQICNQRIKANFILLFSPMPKIREKVKLESSNDE